MVISLKRFLNLFFSKKILGVLILILQIVFIFTTLDRLYSLKTLLYGGTTILSVLAILFEVNRNVSPSFKIIWIAIIGIMPFFGLLLYLYVHSDIFNFDIKKRLSNICKEIKTHTDKCDYALNKIAVEESDENGIFKYLQENANAPCYCNTDIKYFEIGEKMYENLLEDIKCAKKYVFIEFFIINERSFMWKNLKKLLLQKSKEGVDVRIIYDAMGSLGIVSSDFEEQLNNQGIKCKTFSPIKPFISSYHNNRNHRKIVVIDGEIAYTGGINIADEYINKISRFGHWKDSAVRLNGDGVQGFAILFLKMWSFLAKQKTPYDKFINDFKDLNSDCGYFAPFDDNPLDSESVTENIFLHIISNAKKYIYITTPYLILDDNLENSLKFAAKRGVDVRILMPHIPDKWYAFALARTYYPELIKSGVKIYEYTPGFVHAKITLSDNLRAYVGSANYDFRSLYLHYECGTYIYKSPVISEMVEEYTTTLEKCHLFTLEDYKNLKFFYRIAGKIFRFFAPLM